MANILPSPELETLPKNNQEMKSTSLILMLCLFMSCSNGIVEFRPPITGKQVAENWSSIIENSQPCDSDGCGPNSYKLFRVKYPSFSLLFTGSRSEEYDQFETFFHLRQEFEGKTTDMNMFIQLGYQGYLNETEFFHVTENIEIPESDNYIGISDTGLVIPSRQ